MLLFGQGEIALAFGELLRKLWTLDRTAVVPRVFKAKLARFAPQFSGFNQHDSQVSVFTCSHNICVDSLVVGGYLWSMNP